MACQTLYHSIKLSEDLGFPLNTQITISFKDIDVCSDSIGELFSKLRRERYCKWASRPNKGKNKFTPAYAFTFENALGEKEYNTIEDGNNNIHVNWLVHIPPDRMHEFRNIVWDWVSTVFGEPKSGKAIHIQEITFTPKKLMGYAMKGAPQKFLNFYGSGQTHIPQGYIPWRRTGTSRNLGPTSRRRFDTQNGIIRRLPTK